MTVTIDILMSMQANTATGVGTLPEWARPTSPLYGAILCNSTSGRIAGQIFIGDDGTVELYAREWSSSQIGTISFVLP